ncbi:MAG: hypothetical protein Q9228_007325 [Teloschistes exilis]
MNLIHSTLDTLRDRFAPVSHTSTFRTTGQITPEEFLLAGDYLVYKFPTWSWSDASPPNKRVAYLPPGKQYLVTRGAMPVKRKQWCKMGLKEVGGQERGRAEMTMDG